MDWKLYSLEMDEGGMDIGAFFEREKYPIHRVNPGKRLKEIEGFIADFQKTADKEIVAKAVAECIKTDSRVLALYGHGGYHFFTYGLAMLANKLSDEFGYIHIDRHHDSWFYNWEKITCGGFVRQINLDTHVYGSSRRMIYIGNDGGATANIFLGNVIRDNIAEELEKTLKVMRVDDVYVTVDLDVMPSDDVMTAFERGKLRKDDIKAILKTIRQQKRIISADIVGFTESTLPYIRDRSEILPSFEQSMSVYKELADIIMEKDQ
ncbi:MAG: arginase family protein [Candidatus Nanoarchaeia archaeon]|jgi:arginase family enzyme